MSKLHAVAVQVSGVLVEHGAAPLALALLEEMHRIGEVEGGHVADFRARHAASLAAFELRKLARRSVG